MTTQAVLLDALGTLVELQPPAPRLRALLEAEGFSVSPERAEAGFRAEIAYYLAHHLEGSDRAALDDLRDRCAAVMLAALELPGLDHASARRAMLGALEFRPYEDVERALRALRARGITLVIASNWDCSLADWLGPAGLLELVDGVVTSAEVGASKPDVRVFERALARCGRPSGGRGSRGGFAGERRCGRPRGGHPAGARVAGFPGAGERRGGPLAARIAPSTLLRAMEQYAIPRPPPKPPELPDGLAPRWPAWYAGVGFLVALTGTLVAVGVVAAITGATSDEGNPTFTIVATFIQGVVFVGTAVLFASFTRRPEPWHFGLRRVPFWQAVGWAALGMFCFYVFAAVYTAVVQPDAEQTVAQDLGADEGTFGMIAAGFMVVCVAPVAEEFFFRGFFYRALRSRFSVIVAAAIDGALFGVIHFDFSGTDALLILPPLAVLGFMFCLVYERTGSLYPVIALHAFNNALAFGIQAEAWEVSAVLGPLMLLACALVPRFTRRTPAFG